MICPSCGSQSVNFQAVAHQVKKGKGCLYWLFIGWWLETLLWIFFTVPMIFIAIFMPKRMKSKTHSEAVCQNCGYHWKVG